jgi:hypothetical protein
MSLRFRVLLPLLALLTMLPAHSGAATTARPIPAPLCFPGAPGIADCINPRFRAYWERNGGLAVFGYPISPALPEQTADGLRTVQHFERNRIELHPESPAPYDLQLGRLGADRLAQLGRGPTSPVAPNTACRFFEETGHNLCGRFLTYWQSHGLDLGDPGISERESLALFGLPLTEPEAERNAAGDTVPTQWFERARLEDHSFRTPDTPVLQGLLDVELQTALTPAPAEPGWVEIKDGTLVQHGRPIMLKGLNYYPSAQPWSHMWREWDGPAVERELARARRELGINVVRILVPFRKVEGWQDDYRNIPPRMLNHLRQFVQIAGQQQLKVIVTLFDWHDSIEPAGSDGERADLYYLRTIVDIFKQDDRVLAWDLHNEPDNYPAWERESPPAVVDWLWRMAAALRQIDLRHPITVGVGDPGSLWQAAPDGRSIADLSDIISVHSYDAARYPELIAEVHARTSKPVLLEEFGWPSGPECRGVYYDEPSQLYLYRQAMQASATSGLVGMLGWWYQDPPATLVYATDENGHFGLYRRDGEAKPAVAPFRQLRVPALPSLTQSSYPLTVMPPPAVSPERQPLIFDDGLVLRDAFKEHWSLLGGEELVGRPLTLAYRDAAGTLVQYFERARFELNEGPDATRHPVFLTPLGQQIIAGRHVERVPDPGHPEVRYFPQTGHTLSGAFRALWETRGEGVFGLPLTEVSVEQVDGRQVRVQFFTYWRFEQEGDGPVRLGRLGAEALRTRQCPRPY